MMDSRAGRHGRHNFHKESWPLDVGQEKPDVAISFPPFVFNYKVRDRLVDRLADAPCKTNR